MLKVFYEDQDVIVVKKPVGTESQAVHSFAPDMVSEIKKHIHRLSTENGERLVEDYVGVIHRLDKPVGGIMVYAKNKKAAAALSKQVQEHKLQKDEKANVSKIVDKGTIGAKRAELDYRVVDTAEKEGQELSLVEIHLKTGRHHQIRVQFAGHGYPLWADARYGTAVPRQNVALSSCGLAFEHPVTGKWMEFSMEPEGMIFRKFTKKFFV